MSPSAARAVKKPRGDDSRAVDEPNIHHASSADADTNSMPPSPSPARVMKGPHSLEANTAIRNPQAQSLQPDDTPTAQRKAKEPDFEHFLRRVLSMKAYADSIKNLDRNKLHLPDNWSEIVDRTYDCVWALRNIAQLETKKEALPNPTSSSPSKPITPSKVAGTSLLHPHTPRQERPPASQPAEPVSFAAIMAEARLNHAKSKASTQSKPATTAPPQETRQPPASAPKAPKVVPTSSQPPPLPPRTAKSPRLTSQRLILRFPHPSIVKALPDP